jgi:hypothetical protein
MFENLPGYRRSEDSRWTRRQWLPGNPGRSLNQRDTVQVGENEGGNLFSHRDVFESGGTGLAEEDGDQKNPRQGCKIEDLAVSGNGHEKNTIPVLSTTTILCPDR